MYVYYGMVISLPGLWLNQNLKLVVTGAKNIDF